MTKFNDNATSQAVIEISKSKIEQLDCALMQISELSAAVERLVIDIRAAEDERSIDANLRASEALAGQIGFLADLCQSKIGGVQVRGCAENWMLPPLYHHNAEHATAVG